MTKINDFTLKNGLKVIFVEDRANPVMSIQLYVRSGSNWEYDNEDGFSHLTEHLVFKSTANYPDNSIMERTSFLGGAINAYTEFDSTCYFLTLPSEFQAEAIKIISELAYRSNFSDADFGMEKNVVLEEQKQYRNDPEEYFLEEIPALYYKNNPYRKPIVGSISTINAAKASDLRAFYERVYSPKNCYLVISGDISEQTALHVKEYFGSWEGEVVVPKEQASEPQKENTSFDLIKNSIQNPYLAYVLPELAEENPESYPLAFITKVFAVGKNSRLYKRLYHQDGLIDHIRVHSLCGILDGLSILQILPKPNADIYRINEIVKEEFSLLCKKGIGYDEAEKQKKELLFSYRYGYEYVESLGMSIGGEELIGDWRRFLSYPERIHAIDDDLINTCLKKWYKKSFIGIYYMGQGEIDASKILAPWQVKKISTIKNTSANDYYEKMLSNGIKLMLKKINNKPTIGISLSVPLSHLNETAGERGANSLTSALLLYGNQNRTYEEFLEYCTSHGIHASVSAISESTSIRFKCFKELLNESLEMLGDVLFTPTFPPTHFETIRHTYLTNFDRIEDYPQYWANILWKEQIFGKNSNMIRREGNKEKIKAVDQKMLENWHKKIISNKKISLAVVGNLEFDELYDKCEAIIARHPREVSKEQSTAKMIIENTVPGTIRKALGKDQSIIHIGGMASNALQTKKNSSMNVLSQILGGDINSRLFEKLREEMGVAYTVGFDYSAYRQYGYYCAYAIVDAKAENESIAAIKDVIREARNGELTAQELLTAKNFIKGQRLLEEESVFSKAHIISILESLDFGYDYYLARNERLEAVHLDDLQAVASEFLCEDKQFIHVLS